MLIFNKAVLKVKLRCKAYLVKAVGSSISICGIFIQLLRRMQLNELNIIDCNSEYKCLQALVTIRNTEMQKQS